MAVGLSSHPKLSPTSSNLISSSSKLKTVVQTFILSHLYRIARALTKAKSLFIQVVKDIQFLDHFMVLSIKKNNKYKNKLFLGSFRMHYNWCSSHVVPVPNPMSLPPRVLQGYYDSTWNSNSISSEYQEIDDSSDLSGYLHWLEQKAHHHHHHHHHQDSSAKGGHTNDIDRLADMFIANSHEKFRLEKQESYRRFQEMMARSV